MFSRYPGRRLLAMGFSLGGNTLCRYVGTRAERGQSSPVAGIVTVGNP